MTKQEREEMERLRENEDILLNENRLYKKEAKEHNDMWILLHDELASAKRDLKTSQYNCAHYRGAVCSLANLKVEGEI